MSKPGKKLFRNSVSSHFYQSTSTFLSVEWLYMIEPFHYAVNENLQRMKIKDVIAEADLPRGSSNI